jgi:uncharacterized protein DUF3616
MANWFSAVANALGLKKKLKATPFGQMNGSLPFNASGVVHVGPGRFVFVDNHDPSALFELALDADGVEVERISRRAMVGLAEDDLRDPEGLALVGRDGETVLVVASSLCVLGGNGSGRHRVSDGLVRVRYTPHGDLTAEPMRGFRDWLLQQVPSVAAAAEREPDAGGLNIEGLGWQSDTRTLLFGLRGPYERGLVTIIRVPVDAHAADWVLDSLGAPSVVRVALPQPKAKQGIRDISYDERTGSFLIVVGRSTSTDDEPFQLCTWDGNSDTVHLLDIKFHRSMKPEGVVAFSNGDERQLLIVDDRGGYAVTGYPKRDQ